MEIPKDVLNWLLEKSNPSVRYRTLTELLDYSADRVEVVEVKQKIPDSKPIVKILSQIDEHSEWPWIGSYDAPEYGIGYLGELGLDRSHAKAHQAIEIYLSKQYADGSFPSSYSARKDPENSQKNDNSCYYALTILGLIRMGYRDEESVKKALNFTLSETRWDGGYLCTKSYVKSGTKSCIRGSKNILLLFSELPALWETPACQNLVNYFLERKVFYKRSNPTQFVQGYPQTYFPFHYRFGVLEPLYALSKMGYGDHAAVRDAWSFLNEKKDETGRYRLDWTLPQCAFSPGKKGQANKWVTLYAYLALKHKTT